MFQRLSLRAFSRSILFAGLIALAAAGGWHLAPSEETPVFAGH